MMMMIIRTKNVGALLKKRDKNEIKKQAIYYVYVSTIETGPRGVLFKTHRRRRVSIFVE
jgi:hypothetical protein